MPWNKFPSISQERSVIRIRWAWFVGSRCWFWRRWMRTNRRGHFRGHTECVFCFSRSVGDASIKGKREKKRTREKQREKDREKSVKTEQIVRERRRQTKEERAWRERVKKKSGSFSGSSNNIGKARLGQLHPNKRQQEAATRANGECLKRDWRFQYIISSSLASRIEIGNKNLEHLDVTVKEHCFARK